MRGTLDDLDVLQSAAAAADAVIHTAFNHDFSKFAENSAQDRAAIEALGSAIEGSTRPFIVASGVALLAPGRVATEEDVPAADDSYPRRSEAAAGMLRGRGVHAAAMRLPPTVHGIGDQGFMTALTDIARRNGVSAFIGGGLNRWSAVHRLDAARAYRLALEHGATERVYHAIAEEGVEFKQIARAIGDRLGVPVEPRPPQHFEWLAGFVAADMPASSARTKAVLGWRPRHPTLLDDLAQPNYSATPAEGTNGDNA